jgi:hypothetical protein
MLTYMVRLEVGTVICLRGKPRSVSIKARSWVAEVKRFLVFYRMCKLHMISPDCGQALDCIVRQQKVWVMKKLCHTR